MPSNAELTLAAQLEQAGIPFEREYKFHPSRKWRADFFLTDEEFRVFADGTPGLTAMGPGQGWLVEIGGGGHPRLPRHPLHPAPG